MLLKSKVNLVSTKNTFDYLHQKKCQQNYWMVHFRYGR